MTTTVEVVPVVIWLVDVALAWLAVPRLGWLVPVHPALFRRLTPRVTLIVLAFFHCSRLGSIQISVCRLFSRGEVIIMTRIIRPLFTRFEASTQTNLGSSEFDGEPGDAIDLYVVVFPEIKEDKESGGKGKGGKGKGGIRKKAQSAHTAPGYKSSPGYAEYHLPKSKKLRKSQVNKLLDRFGRWLEEKKPVPEVRKTTVPQGAALGLAPAQKVGLVIDEDTLVVDVVELLEARLPVQVDPFLDPQPSTSGQVAFHPSTSGQVDFQPSTSGQVDFYSSLSTTFDSVLNLSVPAPVEAVSASLGIELTPEEATTVVSVSELAAALPFCKNPTLGASALPGPVNHPPNSWPLGQPDFTTLSDIELLDPFQDWGLGSFELDTARIEASHPSVIPGAAQDVFVTEEQSKLPWEETDDEEEKEESRTGLGDHLGDLGDHLGEEFWNILPF